VATRGPKRRRRRSVGRWLAVGVLALVGLLYVQPLRTYLETRATVARKSAEVRALEAERRELERRLAAQTSTPALVREARRLALVKPGERLYIVKGIDAWRREQARRSSAASTLGGDG
jgi:cell division protein FtsB